MDLHTYLYSEKMGGAMKVFILFWTSLFFLGCLEKAKEVVSDNTSSEALESSVSSDSTISFSEISSMILDTMSSSADVVISSSMDVDTVSSSSDVVKDSLSSGETILSSSLKEIDSLSSSSLMLLSSSSLDASVLSSSSTEIGLSSSSTPDMSSSMSSSSEVVMSSSDTIVLSSSSVVPKANGFTSIIPSEDSKLIYVSNSMGDDDNDCLSKEAPCKTLRAGINKMRTGYPDHLYIKAGDQFKDETLDYIKSGRSPDEPSVATYYGEGPRPEVGGLAWNLGGGKTIREKVHFIGLYFTGKISFVEPHSDILFEDCIFKHEVTIQGTGGRGITIRRSIWLGAYWGSSSIDKTKRPSNLFMNHWSEVLLEENVLDYGGWHPTEPNAGANQYNHNAYLNKELDGNSLVVRNNIFSRGSSHGAQMRPGGLADNNFFGRNTIGLLFGTNKGPMKPGVTACGINNVISEGHSMVKGDNACVVNGLCTGALWGLEMYLNDDNPDDLNLHLHHNIVSKLASENPGVDDLWPTVFTKLSLKSIINEDEASVVSSNNVRYHWQSETEGDDRNFVDPERTLGTYYQYLRSNGTIKQEADGEDDFDRFLNVVKNRPAGTWSEALTATAINDYIRDGYSEGGSTFSTAGIDICK